MKVRVISGSHIGLSGSINYTALSLAQRIKALGKECKVTLYFMRKGKVNTISIRVKHLQENLDLFDVDTYCIFCKTFHEGGNTCIGHFP